MKSKLIRRDVRFFACILLIPAFVCTMAACGRQGDTLETIFAEETTLVDAEVSADVSTETTEILSESTGDPNQGIPSTTEEITKPAEWYIHVCGAVNEPGVYRMPADCRVTDAVAAAGGLRSDAAQDAVNLAATLVDGVQLRIPTQAEWEASQEESGTVRAFGSGMMTGGALQDAAGSVGASGDTRVNINTADLTQLCSLPGIGEMRAQSIIDYRTEHGAFASIEEIKQVSGIKEGLFQQICDLICI